MIQKNTATWPGLAKNGGIDKTAVYNIKGVRHIKLKQSLLRTWNNAVAGQWRGDHCPIMYIRDIGTHILQGLRLRL